MWGSKALTTRRRSGANSLKHLDPDVAPAMRYFVERQRQPLAPSYDNETGQLVEPDQYGIALVAVINSTLVNLVRTACGGSACTCTTQSVRVVDTYRMLWQCGESPGAGCDHVPGWRADES